MTYTNQTSNCLSLLRRSFSKTVTGQRKLPIRWLAPKKRGEEDDDGGSQRRQGENPRLENFKKLMSAICLKCFSSSSTFSWSFCCAISVMGYWFESTEGWWQQVPHCLREEWGSWRMSRRFLLSWLVFLSSFCQTRGFKQNRQQTSFSFFFFW